MGTPSWWKNNRSSDVIKGILHLALSSKTELELEYRQPGTDASRLKDETSQQQHNRSGVPPVVDGFVCLAQVI
jgi:hypothetical protein